jgi:hypothetical protein
MQDRHTAKAKPPGIWPTTVSANLTILGANPPRFIMFAAKMKKGMAINVNLSIPENIRWTAMPTDKSVNQSKETIEESRRAT